MHDLNRPLGRVMGLASLSAQHGHLSPNTKTRKSLANANGNAQQWCMFKSPVKQSLSQSPEGARRPAANYL